MATFYMTIGLPGCGKSTWSENKGTEPNTCIISSDSIRKEVFGDVDDQTHNTEVFNLMKKRTHENLRDDINVIYDATNLNRKRRTNFLKELSTNVHKVAVLFAIPFNICCERNEGRERVVPSDVMWKFYKNFQTPWYTEGFDKILIVNDMITSAIARASLYLDYVNSATLPHDNPHHSTTLGYHMKNAYDYSKLIIERENLNNEDSYILSQAAKWHDIGKVKTKVFTDISGNPTEIAHYYGHDSVGAYDYICAEIINNTTARKDVYLYIANLINVHMVFYNGDATINNMKERFDTKFWQMLEWLHECDINAG